MLIMEICLGIDENVMLIIFKEMNAENFLFHSCHCFSYACLEKVSNYSFSSIGILNQMWCVTGVKKMHWESVGGQFRFPNPYLFRDPDCFKKAI